MAVALADPAVDHVPGVFGVAEHGVDGLGGPAFAGRGGVAGRVGVQPGGDGRHAELVHGAPGEDLFHDRGALRVFGEPGFGAALAGFDRDGVRPPVGEVPVGGGADVPSVQGVTVVRPALTVARGFAALLDFSRVEGRRKAAMTPPRKRAYLLE